MDKKSENDLNYQNFVFFMSLISEEGKRKLHTLMLWLIAWFVCVLLTSFVTHVYFVWQTVKGGFLGQFLTLLSECSGATFEAIVIGFIAAVISWFITWIYMKK